MNLHITRPVGRVNRNKSCVVFPGTVKIDIWGMTFPLQVSGVMLNIDERWVFTKMQFQYALNTNYIVFAKIAAIGTLCALVLLSIMLLVCLAYSRNKVD